MSKLERQRTIGIHSLARELRVGESTIIRETFGLQPPLRTWQRRVYLDEIPRVEAAIEQFRQRDK